MVSFVDATKVRHKRDPGRCFLRAGFHYARCAMCDGQGLEFGERCPDCGGDGRARTKEERLLVLERSLVLPNVALPPAAMPLGAQRGLDLGAA